MIRVAASLMVVTVFFVPGVRAQQSAESPRPAASCPSSSTLDDLIKSLDDAVSGPVEKDRTCMRDLMLPDARMTVVRKQADGSFAPRLLTVDDWINAVRNHGGAPFFEKQVRFTSETYGHFAHLWSTYEIRPTPEGKAEVRGINSIQAVFDGKRWHILTILWESDATAGPIPEKYLP